MNRNFEEETDYVFQNFDTTLKKLGQFEAVSAGEIVQLNPKCGKFAGCLIVVTRVESWGVVGYNQIPGGSAYYRAEWGEFEKTGGFAPYVQQ